MDKDDLNIEAYSRLISVGLLAAGVAHEIANPTAYIKSNTAYLLRNIKALRDMPNLSGDQRNVLAEALEILQENAEGIVRIERLVHELKSYSRPSGTVGPVALADVLESAVILTWNRLKYKADLARDMDTSVVVHADYGKVEEVAVNLLNNAADAMQTRGRITLRVYKRNGFGCFDVQDNGPGIPSDKQARVFEPFFTTKGKSGTGLGLYLCKKIVQEAGGTIKLDSEAGKGAKFTVCIPLADA